MEMIGLSWDSLGGRSDRNGFRGILSLSGPQRYKALQQVGECDPRRVDVRARSLLVVVHKDIRAARQKRDCGCDGCKLCNLRLNISDYININIDAGFWWKRSNFIGATAKTVNILFSKEYETITIIAKSIAETFPLRQQII